MSALLERVTALDVMLPSCTCPFAECRRPSMLTLPVDGERPQATIRVTK